MNTQSMNLAPMHNTQASSKQEYMSKGTGG